MERESNRKMTRQDVTNELKEVINELNRIKTGRPINDYDRRDKAIEIAKAAIRKQIPQKPDPEHQYYGNGKCKCGAVFTDKSTNYCGNCGQALDWNDC